MLKKGKVLKVKIGFNPNSSSIGTDISIFLWSSLTAGLIINTVIPAVIREVRKKRKPKK